MSNRRPTHRETVTLLSKVEDARGRLEESHRSNSCNMAEASDDERAAHAANEAKCMVAEATYTTSTVPAEDAESTMTDEHYDRNQNAVWHAANDMYIEKQIRENSMKVTLTGIKHSKGTKKPNNSLPKKKGKKLNRWSVAEKETFVRKAKEVCRDLVNQGHLSSLLTDVRKAAVMGLKDAAEIESWTKDVQPKRSMLARRGAEERSAFEFRNQHMKKFDKQIQKSSKGSLDILKRDERDALQHTRKVRTRVVGTSKDLAPFCNSTPQQRVELLIKQTPFHVTVADKIRAADESDDESAESNSEVERNRSQTARKGRIIHVKPIDDDKPDEELTKKALENAMYRGMTQQIKVIPKINWDEQKALINLNRPTTAVPRRRRLPSPPVSSDMLLNGPGELPTPAMFQCSLDEEKKLFRPTPLPHWPHYEDHPNPQYHIDRDKYHVFKIVLAECKVQRTEMRLMRQEMELRCSSIDNTEIPMLDTAHRLLEAYSVRLYKVCSENVNMMLQLSPNMFGKTKHPYKELTYSFNPKRDYAITDVSMLNPRLKHRLDTIQSKTPYSHIQWHHIQFVASLMEEMDSNQAIIDHIVFMRNELIRERDAALATLAGLEECHERLNAITEESISIKVANDVENHMEKYITYPDPEPIPEPDADPDDTIPSEDDIQAPVVYPVYIAENTDEDRERFKLTTANWLHNVKLIEFVPEPHDPNEWRKDNRGNLKDFKCNAGCSKVREFAETRAQEGRRIHKGYRGHRYARWNTQHIKHEQWLRDEEKGRMEKRKSDLQWTYVKKKPSRESRTSVKQARKKNKMHPDDRLINRIIGHAWNASMSIDEKLRGAEKSIEKWFHKRLAKSPKPPQGGDPSQFDSMWREIIMERYWQQKLSKVHNKTRKKIEKMEQWEEKEKVKRQERLLKLQEKRSGAAKNSSKKPKRKPKPDKVKEEDVKEEEKEEDEALTEAENVKEIPPTTKPPWRKVSDKHFKIYSVGYFKLMKRLLHVKSWTRAKIFTRKHLPRKKNFLGKVDLCKLLTIIEKAGEVDWIDEQIDETMEEMREMEVSQNTQHRDSVSKITRRASVQHRRTSVQHMLGFQSKLMALNKEKERKERIAMKKKRKACTLAFKEFKRRINKEGAKCPEESPESPDSKEKVHEGKGSSEDETTSDSEGRSRGSEETDGLIQQQDSSCRLLEANGKHDTIGRIIETMQWKEFDKETFFRKFEQVYSKECQIVRLLPKLRSEKITPEEFFDTCADICEQDKKKQKEIFNLIKGFNYTRVPGLKTARWAGRGMKRAGIRFKTKLQAELKSKMNVIGAGIYKCAAGIYKCASGACKCVETVCTFIKNHIPYKFFRWVQAKAHAAKDGCVNCMANCKVKNMKELFRITIPMPKGFKCMRRNPRQLTQRKDKTLIKTGISRQKFRIVRHYTRRCNSSWIYLRKLRRQALGPKLTANKKTPGSKPFLSNVCALFFCCPIPTMMADNQHGEEKEDESMDEDNDDDNDDDDNGDGPGDKSNKDGESTLEFPPRSDHCKSVQTWHERLYADRMHIAPLQPPTQGQNQYQKGVHSRVLSINNDEITSDEELQGPQNNVRATKSIEEGGTLMKDDSQQSIQEQTWLDKDQHDAQQSRKVLDLRSTWQKVKGAIEQQKASRSRPSETRIRQAPTLGQKLKVYIKQGKKRFAKWELNPTYDPYLAYRHRQSSFVDCTQNYEESCSSHESGPSDGSIASRMRDLSVASSSSSTSTESQSPRIQSPLDMLTPKSSNSIQYMSDTAELKRDPLRPRSRSQTAIPSSQMAIRSQSLPYMSEPAEPNQGPSKSRSLLHNAFRSSKKALSTANMLKRTNSQIRVSRKAVKRMLSQGAVNKEKQKPKALAMTGMHTQLLKRIQSGESLLSNYSNASYTKAGSSSYESILAGPIMDAGDKVLAWLDNLHTDDGVSDTSNSIDKDTFTHDVSIDGSNKCAYSNDESVRSRLVNDSITSCTTVFADVKAQRHKGKRSRTRSSTTVTYRHGKDASKETRRHRTESRNEGSDATKRNDDNTTDMSACTQTDSLSSLIDSDSTFGGISDLPLDRTADQIRKPVDGDSELALSVPTKPKSNRRKSIFVRKNVGDQGKSQTSQCDTTNVRSSAMVTSRSNVTNRTISDAQHNNDVDSIIHVRPPANPRKRVSFAEAGLLDDIHVIREREKVRMSTTRSSLRENMDENEDDDDILSDVPIKPPTRKRVSFGTVELQDDIVRHLNDMDTKEQSPIKSALRRTRSIDREPHTTVSDETIKPMSSLDACTTAESSDDINRDIGDNVSEKALKKSKPKFEQISTMEGNEQNADTSETMHIDTAKRKQFSTDDMNLAMIGTLTDEHAPCTSSRMVRDTITAAEIEDCLDETLDKTKRKADTTKQRTKKAISTGEIKERPDKTSRVKNQKRPTSREVAEPTKVSKQAKSTKVRSKGKGKVTVSKDETETGKPDTVEKSNKRDKIAKRSTKTERDTQRQQQKRNRSKSPITPASSRSSANRIESDIDLELRLPTGAIARTHEYEPNEYTEKGKTNKGKQKMIKSVALAEKKAYEEQTKRNRARSRSPDSSRFDNVPESKDTEPGPSTLADAECEKDGKKKKAIVDKGKGKAIRVKLNDEQAERMAYEKNLKRNRGRRNAHTSSESDANQSDGNSTRTVRFQPTEPGNSADATAAESAVTHSSLGRERQRRRVDACGDSQKRVVRFADADDDEAPGTSNAVTNIPSRLSNVSNISSRHNDSGPGTSHDGGVRPRLRKNKQNSDRYTPQDLRDMMATDSDDNKHKDRKSSHKLTTIVDDPRENNKNDTDTDHDDSNVAFYVAGDSDEFTNNAVKSTSESKRLHQSDRQPRQSRRKGSKESIHIEGHHDSDSSNEDKKNENRKHLKQKADFETEKAADHDALEEDRRANRSENAMWTSRHYRLLMTPMPSTLKSTVIKGFKLFKAKLGFGKKNKFGKKKKDVRDEVINRDQDEPDSPT